MTDHFFLVGGYVFGFAFMLKAIFHVILDYKVENKITIGSGIYTPIEYFMPYRRDVETKNFILKSICNYSYYFSVFGFLILGLIYGLAK